MSVSIRTENIQTTVSALNGDFSGRRGSLDYDERKPIHIHRRNRAEVWSHNHRVGFKDSILKGYYIPPIICCSRIVVTPTGDHVERREVMDGGNRITAFRRILNDEVGVLTPEDRRVIEAHPITIVVMRNLTNSQTREMFRRLNKNIKVSDGQLYSMSEEDSPLVREALSLLDDDDYPLRNSITDYFFDTRNRDSDGKVDLANAVALISGALHGPPFITKAFTRQEEHVESQNVIDRKRIITILGHVFDVFRQANEIKSLTDGRKKKAQWPVGKYLGVILYDILMNLGSIPQVQKKWATYIGKVRNETENATEAIHIPSAQNISADKLKRMSMKVEIYLSENRIMTKEELNQVRHPVPTDSDSENGDEDESAEDSEGDSR